MLRAGVEGLAAAKRSSDGSRNYYMNRNTYYLLIFIFSYILNRMNIVMKQTAQNMVKARARSSFLNLNSKPLNPKAAA